MGAIKGREKTPLVDGGEGGGDGSMDWEDWQSLLLEGEPEFESGDGMDLWASLSSGTCLTLRPSLGWAAV